MAEREAPIVPQESWWPIKMDGDVVVVRQQGRQMAAQLGFLSSDQVQIATAISEIARNILQHAGQGEMRLTRLSRPRGLVIVARDNGPGIADVAQAMEDGYTTSRGLGLGLPGSRRLMDKFDIVSELGQGTTVTMTKWVR